MAMNSAPSAMPTARRRKAAADRSHCGLRGPSLTIVMPPEWAPQRWLWIGFPHLADEWPGYLAAAQEEIAAFANAVAESGQEGRLLVRDEANEARARALVSAKVTPERRVYGDIWRSEERRGGKECGSTW